MINPLATYAEIDIESMWQKIIPVKAINEETKQIGLDFRIWQRYPKGEDYVRTRKGIYLTDEVWKKYALPWLCEYFDYHPKQKP